MNITRYTKYKGTKNAIMNSIMNFLSLRVYNSFGFASDLGKNWFSTFLSYFFYFIADNTPNS